MINLGKLSFNELEQLEKIIAQLKLRKNPRIKADFAYKSRYQDAVFIRERKIKSLERALMLYRKKLETEIYIGYRIRQFNGVEWKIVEEAGDTSKFKSLTMQPQSSSPKVDPSRKDPLTMTFQDPRGVPPRELKSKQQSCPNCKGYTVGRISPTHYFCSECCLEFSFNLQGNAVFFYSDPSGTMVKTAYQNKKGNEK